MCASVPEYHTSLAQMGEQLFCKQQVVGSKSSTGTNSNSRTSIPAHITANLAKRAGAVSVRLANRVVGLNPITQKTYGLP